MKPVESGGKVPELFWFVAAVMTDPSDASTRGAAADAGFDCAFESGHVGLLTAFAQDSTDEVRIARLATLAADHPAAESVVAALLANPATPTALVLELLPRTDWTQAVQAVAAHPSEVALAVEVIQLWPSAAPAVCDAAADPTAVLEAVVDCAKQLPADDSFNPMFAAVSVSEHLTAPVLAALPWPALLSLVDAYQRPTASNPLHNGVFDRALADLLRDRLGDRSELWRALWSVGATFTGSTAELLDGLDAVLVDSAARTA